VAEKGVDGNAENPGAEVADVGSRQICFYICLLRDIVGKRGIAASKVPSGSAGALPEWHVRLR